MIKMIPIFFVENFVEWTRSYTDILHLSLPLLSKIVSGYERPEPIFRESREGEENASGFDDNDSNPSDANGHGLGSLYKESYNSDDNKA